MNKISIQADGCMRRETAEESSPHDSLATLPPSYQIIACRRGGDCRGTLHGENENRKLNAHVSVQTDRNMDGS